VRGDFRITEANAPAIAQICQELDGIPLAIELAAARVRMLAPAQIADRLGDRFHLLTDGTRTAVPRQQTLQASIDWSYELLSEGERTLLRRLSAFTGGWTLDAAEQVCGSEGIDHHAVLDLLTGLVDQSLVTTAEHDVEVRYGLLETVRQYATARLSDPDELHGVAERHLAYYVGLAERAEPVVLRAGRDDPVLQRLATELRFALSAVRRIKDPIELERMRIAERATRAGFAAALEALLEGMSEREVQIELEAAAYRAGADAMAYDTIVASGSNSAVLHFPPTARPLCTGDLVLIDAGAEYRGYASDITRTYPVGGRLRPEQRELHALVRAAELAAIERCAPGAEWRDVHLVAAKVIAEGLVSLGLLRGRPESLLESGAVWLFFPHGIGHLAGLGVRDAGGTLPERRDDPPPYPHLRIDLPLAAGMVVTVEPGVYFMPALLEDPDRRARHRDEVDWERVDAMLEFGGIRIEDNVLITAGGHEVMTADVPVLG